MILQLLNSFNLLLHSVKCKGGNLDGLKRIDKFTLWTFFLPFIFIPPLTLTFVDFVGLD